MAYIDQLAIKDSGGTEADVTAALALKVDGSAVTQPVSDASGSLTVDAPVGTPVFTRLSDGAAALAGQKTMANSVPIVMASDQTPISIGGNQSALSSASWTSATGLNTTVALSITGYNTVSVVITATSTVTAGAITFEVSIDGGTTWIPINMARIDSYTVESVYTLVASTNRGWTSSVDAFTNFRVRLSTAITGTATIGVGIIAQTLPIEPIVSVGQSVASNLNALVSMNPATSGGLSVFHLMSAGTTNATVVKNTPGQLYGWFIYNKNAAARKVVFHNASSTPTAGASVYFSLMIPPLSGANVDMSNGIAFSTGIAITTVTDDADSGTTAVAANDLNINLFYK